MLKTASNLFVEDLIKYVKVTEYEFSMVHFGFVK